MRGYFPIQGQYRNVLPEETGGIDVGDIVTYPYYPTFHGVVTQVDHAYSGGFQDITLGCASLLNFWQYHNMSTNASAFGARPSNSKLKQSLVGNNFTGMTPFSIIYKLFHDTAGAAGQVAFALSDKTNVAAKSTVGGDSLFSLNIRYWEERFKTRMVSLRMHGASGQLFNTAQAAFLGRLSGDEVRSLLNDQWKFKTGAAPASDLFSAARTLNFLRETDDPVTGERVVMGADVINAEQQQAGTSSPKGGGVPGMEINVASMQAFVSDIGEWGQVNLFESTYETKLDIVNKVLEVTGWEFYQDVDGDFVFKPPLYNLDTRASRIYTIKDIDIISLNFSEKEPDVTFVTCNGSQFKNLKGTGLEGEWGVRGQYIDYRLVAQFGWRPGSFETSYYSNPRAMFFAAVARLDVMNIGVNSASCAIPLRPELRPGYPVYIECLDAFYYLPSFNHAMAYGGQCTTNLTLTGKRAAFFAPGVSSRSDSQGSGVDVQTWPKGTHGIASIDLAQTNLPRRPLRVLDSDGMPKIMGFPNVVMALDPEHVNPLFFVAGFDLESVDNPKVLRNVITAAESYNLVSRTISSSGVEEIRFEVDKWQTSKLDPEGKQANQSETGGFVTSIRENRVFTFEELVAVSTKYARLSTEPSKKLETDIEKRNQKSESLLSKRSQLFELEKQRETEAENKKLESQIATLNTEIKQLTADIAALSAGIGSEQEILERSLLQDPDVLYLRDLLTMVVERYQKKTGDFGKPSETAGLLDLLSDKKAIFSNGQQPGFYRYYSSAHPLENMQGQLKLNTTAGEGGSAGEAGGDIPGGRKVVQFVEPTRPGPDGALPEAELGVALVRKGLNILRPYAEEVLSTDQIQTLSFVAHHLDSEVEQTTYEYDDYFSGLDQDHKEAISGAFRNAISSYTPGDTLEETFKSTWDSFTQNWDGPSFPEFIWYADVRYDTATTTNTEIPPNSNPAAAISTLRTIFETELFSLTGANLWARWVAATSPQDDKVRDAAVKDFGNVLKLAAKGKFTMRLGTRTKKKTQFQTDFYSPVFPVSDEGGYEVVGAYRYGRGLQIMPNATLEQLSFVDPLQFATPQAVEDYLETLQGRTPKSIGLTTADRSSTDELPPAYYVQREAERRLIQAIRDNPETPEGLLSEIGGASDGAQFEDPNLTGVKMGNWITRHNEGIFKLPVANAAYALGDLQVHTDMKACACRSTQADVVLEAFTTEKFVRVLPPNVDMITQFSADLMLEQAKPWQRFREAITTAPTSTGRGQASMDTPLNHGVGSQNALETALRLAQETNARSVQVASGGTLTPAEIATAAGATAGATAIEAVTEEDLPEGTELDGGGREGTVYE